MASRHEFNHQHAAAAKSGRNIAPANQGRTLAPGTHHQERPGVSKAPGNYFMAPYKKPARRRKDNPDKLLCAEDGCNAFPMREIEYCTGHARSKGLIDNWSTNRKTADDASE